MKPYPIETQVFDALEAAGMTTSAGLGFYLTAIENGEQPHDLRLKPPLMTSSELRSAGLRVNVKFSRELYDVLTDDARKSPIASAHCVARVLNMRLSNRGYQEFFVKQIGDGCEGTLSTKPGAPKCSAAALTDGNVYLLADMPPPPFIGCETPAGCACMWNPKIDIRAMLQEQFDRQTETRDEQGGVSPIAKALKWLGLRLPS